MAAVLVFLTGVLLIGVTDGVEISCNATQPHITKCFGSPGGTVDVLLVTQFSQDWTYTLNKNNTIIINSGSSVVNHNRYSFNVSTGIFTIKDIDRTDDDTYSFEIFNDKGNYVVNTKFNVSIQAPVSSPRLSWQCLSGGERVSCSAGGDRPRYRWSLDGHPLKDTHLLSGNSTTSDITLKLGLSGLLSCSVCNDVSEATANQTLSVCGGFIYVNCISNGTHISQWVHKDNNTLCIETTPTEEPDNDNKTATIFIVGGSLSAVALLLIVAMGVYCAQQKKKTSKDPADAEDVTYANISVLQRQGRQRERRESEVEDWRVKVAPGGRQTVETNMDDCLYAQPRRMRR
ncbi:T-cell surface antigen CD2 [Merluccius polli]|uniref:T-cell surface antigen CD2 n=1 Tax=Merluccius polli TaxID=89951 RepID=A0AA47N407_MERPO|nr:T-cell surface antigen CD2 [Merluccius polli]